MSRSCLKEELNSIAYTFSANSAAYHKNPPALEPMSKTTSPILINPTASWIPFNFQYPAGLSTEAATIMLLPCVTSKEGFKIVLPSTATNPLLIDLCARERDATSFSLTRYKSSRMLCTNFLYVSFMNRYAKNLYKIAKHVE